MKILYICTHNRCRSILSEAITNHMADKKIVAYSAGSQPSGQVHPLSLTYLQARGISTEGLKSQSWDEFEAVDPDVVVTVCDSAASEVCPVWFGDTIKVHWALPDPSRVEGSDSEIRAAFFSVMDTIENRVRKLLSLDFNSMTRTDMQTALAAIAETN